jgi:hypothetical protein
VIALLNGGAADASKRYVSAFRQGLSESDCVEGRNVTVEYHWLNARHLRTRGAPVATTMDTPMRCNRLISAEGPGRRGQGQRMTPRQRAIRPLFSNTPPGTRIALSMTTQAPCSDGERLPKSTVHRRRRSHFSA